MKTVKEKEKTFFKTSGDQFGIKNPMASPRVIKVIVNTGTGKATRKDKKINELIADRLSKITGQKASVRAAKKSIASFKLRQGEQIGFVATLRGKRMYDFLDRLLNVAIPRMRDFRGFDKKIVDEMGNLTMGIREHNIFPETSNEDIKNVFGFSVTIVTDAKTHNEAIALFESIGVMFKKDASLTV